MTRPLRLRWTRQPIELANGNSTWWLHLERVGPKYVALSYVTLGVIEQKTSRPNSYEAHSSTGQVLRGNNRRRLQRKLKDAVCNELATVAGAVRRTTAEDIDRIAAMLEDGKKISRQLDAIRKRNGVRRGRAA